MPSWMMEKVDREAKSVGMTGRSVIEVDQFNFRCTLPVMVTGVANRHRSLETEACHGMPVRVLPLPERKEIAQEDQAPSDHDHAGGVRRRATQAENGMQLP